MGQRHPFLKELLGFFGLLEFDLSDGEIAQLSRARSLMPSAWQIVQTLFNKIQPPPA